MSIDFFNNYRVSLGMNPIDLNWLDWFVGFAEGDGALLKIDWNLY